MAIRRRKIENLVDQLLEQQGIRRAPVSVARVAKAQGVKIFYQSLEDDVCGFLYREGSQAVIGVNTHQAAVRQNFTAAHELGHLLLHEQEPLHLDHGFRVRLRDEVSGQGTDEAEREANLFAATLLMPGNFLERDLADKKDVDLTDDDFLRNLARKYGVSTLALVNRLKNLGYLQDA